MWAVRVGVVASLQPLNGASGTPDRTEHQQRNRFNPSRVHLKHTSQQRPWIYLHSFNPSRVHLKPACFGTDSLEFRSFNPSRVHLELAPGTSTSAQGVASTPQGCIWNFALRSADRVKWYGLQPLKGASGTRWIASRTVVRGPLQPLKGASGTMHTTAVADVLSVYLRP